MLYDRKWDQKVKADPYTLAALIAWLEVQPPKRSYNYNCQSGSCLLDSYLEFVTGEPSRPTALHWEVCGDGNINDGGSKYYAIARVQPWTYGAALKRARAVAGH